MAGDDVVVGELLDVVGGCFLVDFFFEFWIDLFVDFVVGVEDVSEL